MDILMDDIILYFVDFLDDKHKIYFLSSSKNLHILKTRTHYNKRVIIDKIKNLCYYDMFTNVEIGEILDRKLPNSTTHMKFNGRDKVNYIYVSVCKPFTMDIKKFIPSSVKHLTFD